MRSLGTRLMMVVASGHQVLLATASTSSISGCSSVTVSGAGLSSGTYRGLSSTSFYMAAGTDYHELYYYSGAWYIDPYVAGYPKYRTYDEVTDPTDITLDWAECDSLSCDWDVVVSITITCADTSSTSSSLSTTTACTSITIEDFGIFTGTYREISATSYDELYYRAGGTDYYYVYLSGNAWYIDPVVAGYPQYRTYDDAAHPVDLTLGWAECGSLSCDWDEPAPSPIVISCADDTEEEAAASTCSSVTISDWDDFTGTYTETASTYAKYFAMSGGTDTYSLYVYDGAWYLEPDDAGYPKYRTFDDADHPADITLDWVVCSTLGCDWDVPTASAVPIACEGSSSDATSTSATDGATSTTDTDASTSDPTVTSGTDVVTSTDAQTLTSDSDATTALDETDDATPTPEPSSSSSNSGAPTSGDTTSPPAGTETVDDGGDDSGDSLSAGVIAAISAVALALVGGGLGVAFKHNSIHCCSRQHISNSSVA